jgi:hypothetical protein
VRRDFREDPKEEKRFDPELFTELQYRFIVY